MKNIVIALLTVLLVLSLVYAYVQQGYAREQKKLAESNAVIAQRNAEEALVQKMLAEAAMAKATKALADCVNNRK
jgi:hypothetical protein